MPTEESAIDPATWLFLFAHPDDEFGVFAEIERGVGCGRRIVVVYLTKSARGAKCQAARERESYGVLRRLGVATADIHFLGPKLELLDGQLFLHCEKAAAELAMLLQRINVPERTYVPAWEGGHQDHDAVHVIGMAALNRTCATGSMYQFSLYNGAGLRYGLFRVMHPLIENGVIECWRVPLRRRMAYLGFCFRYPSQWKSWVGLFPFYLVSQIAGSGQFLQPVSARRILERPHAGPLLYEARGFCQWDEFDRATSTIRRVIASPMPTGVDQVAEKLP